jgi:hypothetical protein
MAPWKRPTSSRPRSAPSTASSPRSREAGTTSGQAKRAMNAEPIAGSVAVVALLFLGRFGLRAPRDRHVSPGDRHPARSFAGTGPQCLASSTRRRRESDPELPAILRAQIWGSAPAAGRTPGPLRAAFAAHARCRTRPTKTSHGSARPSSSTRSPRALVRTGRRHVGVRPTLRGGACSARRKARAWRTEMPPGALLMESGFHRPIAGAHLIRGPGRTLCRGWWLPHA